MAGLWTNGLPGVVFGSGFQAVSGYERVPVDTGIANGEAPQSAAPTAFMLAALGAAVAGNAASATAGAATLSTEAGTITSESLSTAAGSVYTLTLTNTLVSATSNVQAAAYSKSNTTPGLVVQSVVPGSGSVVIKVLNNGSAALNGTIFVMFQVQPE